MNQPVHYHYGQFPPSDINWERLLPLIGPANAALAKYDGTLSVIPNANILLTPLMTKEAVLSSKIEGTQSGIEEVLKFEADGDSKDISVERKMDIYEIMNYRHAVKHSIDLLKNLPLCQRVIKEAHAILLESVRGHSKLPGDYRRDQNWVGTPGCTIEEARYIPISAEKLQEGMDNWEKYIHVKALDNLVHLAIIHAELEALHPFRDGNGRIGRMCIPLFMSKFKLIDGPMFYISAFFEVNKAEYYDRLFAVSRDSDWTGWCEFFLRAVLVQAQNNQKIASEILKLYEKKKNQVIDLTHSQYAIHALDFIFSKPVFITSQFVKSSEIPISTAKRILSILRGNGILLTLQKGRGRRPALYAFYELLELVKA